MTPEHVVLDVIAIVGLQCSGKSLFSSVAEELGYRVVRTNEFIRGDRFDQEAFLDVLEKLVHVKEECSVLIDSLRSLDQYRTIEARLGTSPYLISIHCDRSERLIRAESRKRRRPQAESFEERERRELSMDIGELFCRSNRILDNTGTRYSEYKSQIIRILFERRSSVQLGQRAGTRWRKEEREICFAKYIR